MVANKVQGPDGKWRSVDSRALHQAVVAVSELYDDLVADHLAARLPVRWALRDRGERRTPAFEIDEVGDAFLAVFSTRSVQVQGELQELVAGFVDAHHRSPTRVEVVRLRTEILLGAIATDDKLEAHKQGVYRHGAWFGRFTWKDRYTRDTKVTVLQAQAAAAAGDWPPLRAGLFGGSAARAEAALAAFVEEAADARSR